MSGSNEFIWFLKSRNAEDMLIVRNVSTGKWASKVEEHFSFFKSTSDRKDNPRPPLSKMWNKSRNLCARIIGLRSVNLLVYRSQTILTSEFTMQCVNFQVCLPAATFCLFLKRNIAFQSSVLRSLIQLAMFLELKCVCMGWGWGVGVGERIFIIIFFILWLSSKYYHPIIILLFRRGLA